MQERSNLAAIIAPIKITTPATYLFIVYKDIRTQPSPSALLRCNIQKQILYRLILDSKGRNVSMFKHDKQLFHPVGVEKPNPQ